MKNIPKTNSQGKHGTDNGTEATYNNLYSFGNSQALCFLIIKFYKGASYICICQNNSFKQVPEIELSMQINPLTLLLIPQIIPHTNKFETLQSPCNFNMESSKFLHYIHLGCPPVINNKRTLFTRNKSYD